MVRKYCKIADILLHAKMQIFFTHENSVLQYLVALTSLLKLVSIQFSNQGNKGVMWHWPLPRNPLPVPPVVCTTKNSSPHTVTGHQSWFQVTGISCTMPLTSVSCSPSGFSSCRRCLCTPSWIFFPSWWDWRQIFHLLAANQFYKDNWPMWQHRRVKREGSSKNL